MTNLNCGISENGESIGDFNIFNIESNTDIRYEAYTVAALEYLDNDDSFEFYAIVDKIINHGSFLGKVQHGDLTIAFAIAD